MINKLLKALHEKDYFGLAACFAPNCKYYDYCPSLNGHENYFVHGREMVEMFFRNRFVHNHFEIASPRAESETEGTFFGSYDAPFVYARLRIEGTDENGLITKLVISAA
ncbi:MAG: nuclear transport factor 2 family protein [Oscillospiraceae bacterium]|nr:nuclear transport factor 2 family protein [Oscillospiraceae bacterium]